MHRKRTQVTPGNLSSSLLEIMSATDEDQCARAIVAAATIIQESILAGQPSDDVTEVLSNCPSALASALATAMDRAVSVSSLEDGSSLALWLLPVVLSSEAALPSTIALETRSINGLKTAAYIQSQMGLDSAGGWVYMLPTLLSAEQIRQARIDGLVKLPHQARAVVRGRTKSVGFRGDPMLAASDPGVSLYFLPFVAHHPVGAAIGLVPASERTMHRVSRWVLDSIGRRPEQTFEAHVAAAPQLFSEALAVGERLCMEVSLREMVLTVCEHAGVEPNGLAALVAPYSVAVDEDDDSQVLGITMVSRLTGAYIATLPISMGTFGPQDQEHQGLRVNLAYRILQDMGMQAIQLRHEPIETFACQHCGNLQYARPTVTPASGQVIFETIQ